MATTAAEGKRGGGGGSPRRLVISTKKSRRSGRKLTYTLEDKEKIILMVEQGWKNCDIQRATGVPESTIRTIKKKKEDLKKSIAVAKRYYSDNTSASKLLMNEITDRRRLIAITEHLLLNWTNSRLRGQGTIDGSDIRAQACIFYQSLCSKAAIKNPPPFRASEGWLAKFKKRCGIEVSSGDSEEDKPIAYLTIRRTARTSYHDIKEEPTSPTSDDPLAILPEEESRLRSVSSFEVLPRVIIPDIRQSLSSSLNTTDCEAHFSTIDPEFDPSTSDSDTTPSISCLDATDVEYEYDFVGFEDDIIKMETEKGNEDPAATAPSPTPPPHPEAITPPLQPAATSPLPQPVAISLPSQPEGIIPDLSSRTPNSEPTLHEGSCPKQQHRISTPHHTQCSEGRQTASCLLTLHEDCHPEEQNRTRTSRHTPSSEVRQAASSLAVLHEDSCSEQQHRTTTPCHTQSNEARPNEARPDEATQADSGGSQPSYVTRVECQQAVHPELQEKQKEEANVHAKFAVAITTAMYPRTMRALKLVAREKGRIGGLPFSCFAAVSSPALQRCEASRSGLSYSRLQQVQLCRRLATADQPPGTGHQHQQQQQQQQQKSAAGDVGGVTPPKAPPAAPIPPSATSATARLKEAVIKVMPRKKEHPRFDSSHPSLERNFITAVRAMSEFLLKPSDLENLRKTKRRSPFENEPPITVYWRKDVEAKAVAVWGSEEALEDEKKKREKEIRRYRQMDVFHVKRAVKKLYTLRNIIKSVRHGADIFNIKRLLREHRRDQRTSPEPRSIPHTLDSSGKVVWAAVVINGANMVMKLGAWAYTGSHSLFAEALHSLADVTNQLILAYGIHKSKQSADVVHPYGYTTMRYVSSLISGAMIFCVGAGLSIQHGITGLLEPSEVLPLYWAFYILGGSLITEGGTLLMAVHAIRKGAQQQQMTFMEYVLRGQDPSVNVVLLEDMAAVIGVGVAMGCMGLTSLLGSHIPDAIGSCLIGGILACVSGFIIYTNSAALVGKSIPQHRLEKINEELEQDVLIRAIYDVKGIDMGTGLVRYKAEVDFDGRELTRGYLDQQDLEALLKEMQGLKTIEEVEAFMLKHGENIVDSLGEQVDRIETILKKSHPEIRHCDLEIL